MIVGVREGRDDVLAVGIAVGKYKELGTSASGELLGPSDGVDRVVGLIEGNENGCCDGSPLGTDVSCPVGSVDEDPEGCIEGLLTG